MAVIRCAECGVTVSDAYGRQKRCKPCQVQHKRKTKREQERRERLQSPEKVRARQKRYREANKEAINAYHRANGFKYRAKKDDWRDEQRFGGLKASVLERDGNLCCMCGAGETDGFRNLAIHHIDGDKTHNVIGNLITLCRICHPMVHNRWNGAGRQDELRALLA